MSVRVVNLGKAGLKVQHGSKVVVEWFYANDMIQ